MPDACACRDHLPRRMDSFRGRHRLAFTQVGRQYRPTDGNTVIFQARPTADALYLSAYEPISHWVTGKQGEWRDQMVYDPLQFMVDEAHKRNMDVHVWLNPYRVTQGVMTREGLAKNHIIRQHPEWFVRSADGTFQSPGAWGVVWADLCKLD